MATETSPLAGGVLGRLCAAGVVVIVGVIAVQWSRALPTICLLSFPASPACQPEHRQGIADAWTVVLGVGVLAIFVLGIVVRVARPSVQRALSLLLLVAVASAAVVAIVMTVVSSGFGIDASLLVPLVAVVLIITGALGALAATNR